MSRGNQLRLRVWRDFRNSIVDLSDDDKLKSINNFWMMHPHHVRTVDPGDCSTWINFWDMVYHDEICEYSRAILMHQTALICLSNITESFLVYAVDHDKQFDRLLAVVDGKVLNYNFEIQDYNLISQSMGILTKCTSDKKGIYTEI